MSSVTGSGGRVLVGRITVLVGAVIAIIGTFLPWASYTGQGTTGFFQRGGVVIIISAFLGLALVFFERARGLRTILFGILVAIFAVLTVLYPGTLAVVQGGRSFPADQALFGVWVSLAGGIVMILGGWSAGTEPLRAAKTRAAGPS